MRLLPFWDFTACSRVDLTFTFPLPFLTSLVDGGEWSTSRPGHITPPGEEGWYCSHMRQGGLWRRENPLASAGFRTEPLTVQPTASIYTDCALPVPVCDQVSYSLCCCSSPFRISHLLTRIFIERCQLTFT
jgi:hypothetical protein